MDLWKVGIARAPMAAWLESDTAPVAHDQITWLPAPDAWSYLVHPFGLQRGDNTHVFVAAFDYRTKHAVIEQHELGPGLQWRGKSVALARPFHVSYPFLIEEDGEVFMVPESHRAGEISLYRALDFPAGWVCETVLLPRVAGVEPSLIKHAGSWWMFFTIVGPNARDQRELHVATSERLTGPWKLHPQNPILDDRSGARPGGTPFVNERGDVVLPVQDCSRTYGGALRFLRFRVLTRDRIDVERIGGVLRGGSISETHTDGFHTLSACGEYTLMDVKRVSHSWGRLALNWRRRARRLLR